MAPEIAEEEFQSDLCNAETKKSPTNVSQPAHIIWVYVFSRMQLKKMGCNFFLEKE